MTNNTKAQRWSIIDNYYNSHLHNFVNSSKRNTWIHHTLFKVYLRRSERYLNGYHCRCLEIANVQVTDKSQGRGLFTHLLDLTEAYASTEGFPVIFIENVSNTRFQKFFRKRQYKTHLIEIGGDKCFYKFIRQAK